MNTVNGLTSSRTRVPSNETRNPRADVAVTTGDTLQSLIGADGLETREPLSTLLRLIVSKFTSAEVQEDKSVDEVNLITVTGWHCLTCLWVNPRPSD